MRLNKLVLAGAGVTLMLAGVMLGLSLMRAHALGGAEWMARLDKSDAVLVPVIIIQAVIIWRVLFKRGLE